MIQTKNIQIIVIIYKNRTFIFQNYHFQIFSNKKVMKISLLSKKNKITYESQPRETPQQFKMIFLQNIDQLSQQILQKYTNNMRMQVKQQLIQLKSPQLSNGIQQQSKQLRKRDLKKWLSEICHSVFSIAYNSYKKSQMTEQQMKIYCSENLILNLIKLTESNSLTVEDYEYIDTVLKNDILSYYKDKYPPTLQKQSYKRFRAKIQDIDTMEDFQEELVKISNLQEQFGKRYKQQKRNNDNNPQYYDLIMQFINFCLQLPDKMDNTSKQQDKSYYDQFNTLMTGIFSRIEDINYMRQLKTQKEIQAISKEKQQQYRQRVKEYTNYKIGRKIPQQIHKFTEEEIKNKNIRIKDPAVLRFLTKWVEQLQQNLENIQSKLISIGQDLNDQKKRANFKIIQKIKAKRKQLLKLFQSKIYQQQQLCDYSYLDKRQIDIIPKNDKLVGVFSFIASQHQSTFIIKSINFMIHALCSLSWTSEQFIVPSISCKIGDLMRCKCSSGEKEILKIYQQLKKQSLNNPDILKIIRTKNRLQKGTKDILINILFKKTILCQVQLSINQSQSSQSKLNSFNHYLYQLQRSKFGPINQLANVFTKDQRYLHISKLLEKESKNIQTACQCGTEDWKEQKNPFPFICNFCNRYYDTDVCFISHKKCRNCKMFWKCSNCSLDQITSKQHGRKELLLQYPQRDDCQLIKVQSQSLEIPQYGMFISKVSKTKNWIEFKAFNLPGQKDIYLVRAEGKINTIIQTIPKEKLEQFFNEKIVFKIKKINQLQGFDDQQFKKTLLLPKNINLIYKNQGEALKWASNNLSDEQFRILTTGKSTNYDNIKSINLCRNKIQAINTILVRFKNLKTLNLRINQLSEIPESLGDLKKLVISQNNIETIPDLFGNLNSLSQLTIKRNKLKAIPESLGNMKSLTKLQMSYNAIEAIPGSIGNLSNLTELDLKQNKLKFIPESLGNLNNLSTLRISQNNIETIPDTFGNLNNLTILDIEKNNINFIPESFGHLKSLTRLMISQNNIEAIHQSFGNLSRLTFLEMQKNKLKVIPEWFANLKSLSTLIMFQNSFEAVPESFGNLKNLSILWINENCIETIPDSFTNMNSLIYLNIKKNKLKVVPESIANLKGLKKLRISQNFIENIPDSFGNLNSLTYLEMYNNKLKAVPESLGNMKSLTKLQMSYNDIEAIPESIGNLSNLTELDVKQNKLKFIPDSFGNLKNLIHLDIEKNNINFIPESFGNLKNLQTLRISQNNIETIPASFGNLNNLSQLTIKRNKLKAIPESLGNMKSLTILMMSYNAIKAIPESLGNLSSLTELDLKQNKLKFIPESLGKMSSLSVLRISYNNIETIPDTFGNLNNLTILDLSQNMINFSRQVLQLFKGMKASIYLKNNKMSLSQQDSKWIKQNKMNQRIHFQ